MNHLKSFNLWHKKSLTIKKTISENLFKSAKPVGQFSITK
jgi:hypothetical protein